MSLGSLPSSEPQHQNPQLQCFNQPLPQPQITHRCRSFSRASSAASLQPPTILSLATRIASPSSPSSAWLRLGGHGATGERLRGQRMQCCNASRHRVSSRRSSGNASPVKRGWLLLWQCVNASDHKQACQHMQRLSAAVNGLCQVRTASQQPHQAPHYTLHVPTHAPTYLPAS